MSIGKRESNPNRQRQPSKHVWLWIPHCVAAGNGPADGSPRLSVLDTLVYLTCLARSSNRDRRWTVDTTAVATRCRCKAKTVRESLRRLQHAGLLGIECDGRGVRPVVRVTAGTSRDHVAVPEAAIWPQAHPAPPRWAPEHTVDAVRALLALLNVLPFPAEDEPVQTDFAADAIARAAGMPTSHYHLGLAALLGNPARPGQGGRVTTRTNGWLSVQSRYQPGGVKQATSIITLDWQQLPAVVPQTAFSTAKNAVSRTTENAVSGTTENAVSRTTENAVSRTSNTGTSLPLAQPSATTTNAAAAGVDTRSRADAHSGDEVVVVDAHVEFASEFAAELGNRADVRVDAVSLASLTRLLRRAEQGGWHPAAIAAAVTATPLTGARSVGALLNARIGAALTGPAQAKPPASAATVCHVARGGREVGGFDTDGTADYLARLAASHNPKTTSGDAA